MTSKPLVSLIAAIDEHRGLGKENRLLFRIKDDHKRFKSITLGHPVIMGRKTYESIGKPLPERTNIVVTRDRSFKADGCIVCHSLDEALEQAKNGYQHEVFVVGGGELYGQSLPVADRLYLTVVKGVYEADVFFPEYDGFREVSREERASDGYEYTFLTLERAL